MVKMGVWAAAVVGCLFAGQAFAQAEGGSFGTLSPGNQKIVEAMYGNQAAPEGGTARVFLPCFITISSRAGMKPANPFDAMRAFGF